MDVTGFDELVSSFAEVRRRSVGDLLRWECRGRLVARQLDERYVVVRVPFEVRDVLLRRAPETFSVPNRFVKHMMIVADLEADDGSVEDAVAAAVQLQTTDY